MMFSKDSESTTCTLSQGHKLYNFYNPIGKILVGLSMTTMLGVVNLQKADAAAFVSTTVGNFTDNSTEGTGQTYRVAYYNYPLQSILPILKGSSNAAWSGGTGPSRSSLVTRIVQDFLPSGLNSSSIPSIFLDGSSTNGLDGGYSEISGTPWAYSPAVVSEQQQRAQNFYAFTASELPPSPTSVPEPFTVIGTLIGGTAAFRMRKKLKMVAK